jgi:antitoxin (DNA-binding transcriptional repressor) of toxin-antitoxin stability system
MRTVGLKTLKNKLSEYVRVAASGETVVIAGRNRIVTEIVPPRRDTSAFFERGVHRAGFPVRQIRLPNPRLGALSGADAGAGTRSGRSLIYLDSSVALAQLFGEGRSPPDALWQEPLVSSRLLEFEV